MRFNNISLVKVILFTSALLNSGLVFADEEYTDLFKLRIQATQGEVIATSTSSGNKVTIKVDRTKINSSCKYEVSQASKELVINAVQTVEGLNCPFQFNVTLPAAVHFDAILTNGNISLNGDFSDSIFDVGTGSIQLNGKGGTVQFKGKKTSVDFKGTADVLEADIDEGPVSIGYSSLPSRGEMRVDSKKGDVVIGIPRGIEISGVYSLEKSQAVYKTRSGFSLLNRVGDGNLTIKRN